MKRKTVRRIATAPRASEKVNKRSVISLLNKGLCKIIFRREDGQFRRMFGTLNEKVAPMMVYPNESTPNLVTLWDVSNAGYRSFRMERLIRIELVG
jgi:hypothetical protein